VEGRSDRVAGDQWRAEKPAAAQWREGLGQWRVVAAGRRGLDKVKVGGGDVW
jgi:hypothetical protein